MLEIKAFPRVGVITSALGFFFLFNNQTYPRLASCDDECTVMVEMDYQRRLSAAEDEEIIERRDAQTWKGKPSNLVPFKTSLSAYSYKSFTQATKPSAFLICLQSQNHRGLGEFQNHTLLTLDYIQHVFYKLLWPCKIDSVYSPIFTLTFYSKLCSGG